jgi:arabinosaccharide transport system permease protein
MRRLQAAFFNPRYAPYVFLAPFLIIFIMFRVAPTIYAVIISFQHFEGTDSTGFVGTQNYTKVFSNPLLVKSFTNTVIYTLGTLLILIPIPLILAAMLDSGRVVKQTLWRTALFLPALTSLVVVSVIFRIVLARDGLLNVALGSAGLPEPKWLELAELAVPSMIILAAWRWTGVNILYFNSGLVNVPRELYEAAALDGAGAWKTFRSVTMPMMKPTILFVLVLSIIGGFQLFVEPLLLWSGGASPGNGGLSVALLIYRTAFTSFNFGQASAMGILLALVVLIASLIQFRFFGLRSDR